MNSKNARPNYNRSPSFQMVPVDGTLDIWTINDAGHWVRLGIDGTQFDPRYVAHLCLDAEVTGL